MDIKKTRVCVARRERRGVKENKMQGWEKYEVGPISQCLHCHHNGHFQISGNSVMNGRELSSALEILILLGLKTLDNGCVPEVLMK